MSPLAARRGDWVLLALSMLGLGTGVGLWLLGSESAHVVWAATAAVALVPALWSVIDAARHRRLGVDIAAALALAGTLVVGEYLAGAVIAVMLWSGRSLEAWATGRAERSLRALLERAPRHTQRLEGDALVPVSVGDVRRGDLLLVSSGEVVPVDGLVVGARAVLDESALTGEPIPLERGDGEAVRSGAVNAGGPFELRATTTSAESTYSAIVQMAADARASSAPFVRLADRYAGLFMLLSLTLAAAALVVSGSPRRAVAVLVVATPCPLIIAAPVAIVSGMSRLARRGVVVKGGAALEQLAGATVLLLDKTGTLTAGHPTLVGIVTAPDWTPDEVLRLAASLDQVSPHVVAAAIVRAARIGSCAWSYRLAVEEAHGQGVRGDVGGRLVAVGNAVEAGSEGAASAWARSARRRAELDALLTVFVLVDGALAGMLLLDDPVRPDAARTVRALRRDGIRRVVLVTGDRDDVAHNVGAVVGADVVLAERTPADKLEAVRLERREGTTVMVGDGVNDAPALALADVGVAMVTPGATASSELADVLLTAGRLDRLGEAVRVARRAGHVARQSVVVGIGLSSLAMVAAALGLLPPAWGALLQEAIDVAVIANALRALGGVEVARLGGEGERLAGRFGAEHARLRPRIDEIRRAADAMGQVPDAEAVGLARRAHRFLVEQLEPHEQAEDAELYPVLARVLGGTDPTGTMSRSHVEISHRIRRLGRLLEQIDPAAVDPEDAIELRRALYGLHAILELHFAQEDEDYLSLSEEATDGTAGAPPSAASHGQAGDPRGIGPTDAR